MKDLPFMLGASSTVGTRVDMVFGSLLVFSVVATVILFILVLTLVGLYYRKTKLSRGGAGATTHSSLPELVFVVVFTVFGLSLFVWSAYLYADIERPPTDTMDIYVVGKQWMWKLYQPTGREEINALHVPVGRNVKLIMTSQDVIHDFAIPDFRVKQDVLPERYTTLWFNATEPGAYRVHCAQYCGADHSVMVGWVYAMKPEDYEQWLDANPSGAPTVNGTPGTAIAPMATNLQGIFNSAGCIACHTPNSAVRAPRLDGIYGQQVRLQNGDHIIADDQYIRESILFPNAKISAGYPAPSLMPSYNGQLTEQQIRGLVDFIKSIRNGWPADSTMPSTQPSVSSGPTKGEPKQ